MMMSLPELIAKYRLKITGVVHVGARLGEEAKVYSDCGLYPVWWIEANPAVMARLRDNVEKYGHRVIEALVYERDGEMLDFHVTNFDGLSSSILAFGTHTDFAPDIKFEKHLKLKSWRLDTLAKAYAIEGCNFMVLDLQGAELHALRGAVEFLKGVDYVFTEVNRDEVYVGCARVEEIDAFLAGFQVLETYWVEAQGWGDRLLRRRGR